MLCKTCHTPMKCGTVYRIKNKKHISERYVMCPNCYFRKYNNGANIQELKVIHSNNCK